jgi:hypothetical protein
MSVEEDQGLGIGKAIRHLGGWSENPVTNMVGGPNPLTALLGTSLLGAGLGYGLGTLGEHILPRKYFDKGKLRQTLGLLGGIGGALPGLSTALLNYQTGRPVWDSYYFQGDQKQASDLSVLLKKLNLKAIETLYTKAAESETGLDLPANVAAVPVDVFNRVVNYDPFTPPALKGLVTSLTSAAAERRESNWITPSDIAGIAASTGAGYLSGLVVGKTLGALAGLKPDTQQKLQQTGIWAGLLSSVVPTILR